METHAANQRSVEKFTGETQWRGSKIMQEAQADESSRALVGGPLCG